MAFSKAQEGKDGSKPMNQFEASILFWIQENLRGALDGFWVFITHLGDSGYFWIAIGIALLIFKKTRPVGITVLLSLAINACMTNLTLKDFFGRTRPFYVNTELVTLIKHPSSFSFPSGHTSGSFSAALVLYHMFPKKIGVPAVILATMIGFSRMYVGVHYPTDILGGIVVAIIASTLAIMIVSKVREKIQLKKS